MTYEQAVVDNEEGILRDMITSNSQASHTIKLFASYARQHVADDNIELAQKYIETIKLIKGQRYSIADIRKQREKIQWEKKSLKQHGKLSQSSSNSVN